ncbi:MAG: acetylxylan esterase [Bacteroidales bacterium]|nr:acetylxylan esterase [Bacteroidales bacterium]
MKRFAIIFLSLVLNFSFAFAAKEDVKVIVKPLAPSTNPIVLPIPDSLHFKKGVPVRFEITIEKDGKEVVPSKVLFSFNEDKMTPTEAVELELEDGKATTPDATMHKSGFLRCNAEVTYNGKTYKGHSMVGFDVQHLQPTVRMPSDFRQWWNAQLTEAAKIPMEPKLEKIKSRCTDAVDVYQVSVQAVEEGFRIYGILSIPKAGGKYPAVMRGPGAGVHKIGGLVDEAAQGLITLDMGVHGVPLTKPQSFYASLNKGRLKDYPTMNIDSRENYYYRRVYLSAVRLAEYLTTLPQFNGNLYICGGSQGGAISIVTAALCPKVTAIEAFFPALADQEAYLQDRAGGWPHYFYFHKDDENIQQIADVVAYYDVANFARILDKPVFMSFGLADLTCAPTCTYSTWNAIATRDKRLVITPQIGHWRDLKVWDEGWRWMLSHKK